MDIPNEDDFLDEKIGSIVKELAQADECLWIGQHGATPGTSEMPEVIALVARGEGAEVVYRIFCEIAEQYGLRFKREL